MYKQILPNTDSGWNYQFSDEGPYASKFDDGFEAYYALDPNDLGEYEWNVVDSLRDYDVVADGAELSEDLAKSACGKALEETNRE